MARQMIGAIVQVLIAEEAAPSLLTNAFPRGGACAVHATGIFFAFVAQLSFPAGLTSAREQIIRELAIKLYIHKYKLSESNNSTLQLINEYNSHKFIKQKFDWPKII